MEETANQKFSLRITNVYFPTYNGKHVLLEDFLNSFSRIMAEKGHPISWSIRFWGQDFRQRFVYDIESNEFPAALLIAIFASPLENICIEGQPFYVVTNESMAFSNNKDLYYCIAETGATFSHMFDVIKTLQRTEMDPYNTKIIGIRHQSPLDIPNILPECIIGTPGYRDNGAVMMDCMLNQHSSGIQYEVTQPVDKSFYEDIWKSLNDIFYKKEDDNTSVSSNDDEEDEVFTGDFDEN